MIKRLFFGLLIIMALGAVATAINGPPKQREQTAEEKETSRRFGLQYAAKKVITEAMRDPSSATFGNVFYSNKAGEAVCGYVNGKNGFGGYTGMKEFVVTVKSGAVAINDGSGKFASSWNKLCAGTKV